MAEETENRYKSTINLPQTDFPMKANLAQREPAQVKAWDDQNVYGRQRQIARQAKTPKPIWLKPFWHSKKLTPFPPLRASLRNDGFVVPEQTHCSNTG